MQVLFNRFWQNELRVTYFNRFEVLIAGMLYWPAFVCYALIITSYFFCLWVLMTLGLKREILLVGKPGFLLRAFVALWNSLPTRLKRWLSLQNKQLYEMPFTTFYIRPYLF